MMWYLESLLLVDGVPYKTWHMVLVVVLLLPMVLGGGLEASTQLGGPLEATYCQNTSSTVVWYFVKHLAHQPTFILYSKSHKCTNTQNH